MVNLSQIQFWNLFLCWISALFSQIKSMCFHKVDFFFFSPLNGNLIIYSPPNTRIYLFVKAWLLEGDHGSPHKLKNDLLSNCPIEQEKQKYFLQRDSKCHFLLRSGIYKLEFNSSSNKDVFHDDIYLVHTLKKAWCDLLFFSWQPFSFIHMYFGLSLTFCLLFLNLHVSHKYKLFFFFGHFLLWYSLFNVV